DVVELRPRLGRLRLEALPGPVALVVADARAELPEAIHLLPVGAQPRAELVDATARLPEPRDHLLQLAGGLAGAGEELVALGADPLEDLVAAGGGDLVDRVVERLAQVIGRMLDRFVQVLPGIALLDPQQPGHAPVRRPARALERILVAKQPGEPLLGVAVLEDRAVDLQAA